MTAAVIATGRRPRRTRKQVIARIAVLVAIALIAVMWIYGFVFAGRKAVAKVQDRAWAQRAQIICTKRNQVIDDTAKATVATSDGSPQDVGLSVKETTDYVETALDDIVSQKPSSAVDQKLVLAWEKLYRTYISDRRAAQAQLAAGKKVELNETMLNGSPISETIADFTSVNQMDACAVPTGR